MRISRTLSVIVGLGLALALPAFGASVPAASLVKLGCPASAKSDDPCKAVYFYGSDRKRHAFPNERTYFSWYADFSGVKTVSPAELSAMPLGRNVTYRPGVKLVKFQTDSRTYAVGLGSALRWIKTESAATALYGTAWNKSVDDISDAFFADYRFGADVASASDFSPSHERALAPAIDDDLPATTRSMSVSTSAGIFQVQLIKLQKDRFDMRTIAAQATDCSDGCAAKSLREYADQDGDTIGMHGAYFCPPDYPACAGKVNTFLWPIFDSFTGSMRNTPAIAWHQGPMLTQGSDGTYRYDHRAADFGSTALFAARTGTALKAAISNYPSLIENGVSVVDGEGMLDDGMKTLKAVRGGIGYDDRFVYLVIAKGATVPDLTRIFQALGATQAMNLDGGGSAALFFNGAYVYGPGRALPDAIMFRPR